MACTIFDVTSPTSWVLDTPRVSLFSGLWAGGHRRWETVGYMLAGMIAAAAVPVLFIAVDHKVAVNWSNAILDLVNAR